MLTLSGSLRVFLALEPCDMRKSLTNPPRPPVPPSVASAKRCPRRVLRFRVRALLVQLGRSCGIASTPASCGEEE